MQAGKAIFEAVPLEGDALLNSAAKANAHGLFSLVGKNGLFDLMGLVCYLLTPNQAGGQTLGPYVFLMPSKNSWVCF